MSIVRPKVVCADGTKISVQASEYHYCTPRSNVGPWTHVEIMLFQPYDTVPDYLKEYVECVDDECGNDEHPVYPNVPLELVVRFIDEHGGRVQINNGRKELAV